MAEVKWIKITTNMFEDEKIDFIESLPEADAILIIWIKLLTLAGKCNANGYILLTEKIPYTEEMLAHKFRKPINIIKLALQTLKNLEMISLNEKGIFITNWDKHQNINGMEKIREQNRLRKRKQREKGKLLKEENSKNIPVALVDADSTKQDKKDKSRDSHVTVTDNVTPCHATEVEVEVEVDKDIDTTTITSAEKMEENSSNTPVALVDADSIKQDNEDEIDKAFKDISKLYSSLTKNLFYPSYSTSLMKLLQAKIMLGDKDIKIDIPTRVKIIAAAMKTATKEYKIKNGSANDIRSFKYFVGRIEDDLQRYAERFSDENKIIKLKKGRSNNGQNSECDEYSSYDFGF